MDGFIEHISNPTIILRMGESTDRKGKAYERTVFAEVRGWRVKIKGYAGEVDPAFFTAVMRKLYRASFSFAIFERLKGRHRTITFKLGPNGAESMSIEYHADQAAE